MIVYVIHLAVNMVKLIYIFLVNYQHSTKLKIKTTSWILVIQYFIFLCEDNCYPTVLELKVKNSVLDRKSAYDSNIKRKCNLFKTV